MKPGVRLASFALALAAVFGAAMAVGEAVDRAGRPSPAPVELAP